MRGFIVLCLVATACAEAGYNYNPSSGGHHGGSSGSLGGGHLGGHGGHSLGGGHGGHSLGGGLGGGSLGGGLGGGSLGGGLGSGSLGGGHGGSSLGGGQGGSGSGLSAGPAEYSKEFYSFSAPDHEFDDGSANQHIANSVKKNLRVVFIKGPENQGLENAALQLAKQAGEDRTAIYVLQKQSDIGNLAQQLQNARSQNQNRPEVHFVKYRTPEDAQNAQHAIQSQYDSLPGSSQSHNGGQAPVLNFASPSQAPQAPAPQSPNNAYLPSSVFRRFRK